MTQYFGDHIQLHPIGTPELTEAVADLLAKIHDLPVVVLPRKREESHREEADWQSLLETVEGAEV